MGLHASAELIWGIPVDAYYEDGYEYRPTPYWSEEDDYWREFKGLKIEPYGHYEDPENRGILTPSGMEPLRGDCWTPKQLSLADLIVGLDVRTPAQTAADTAGLTQIDFLTGSSCGWHLVADFG